MSSVKVGIKKFISFSSHIALRFFIIYMQFGFQLNATLKEVNHSFHCIVSNVFLRENCRDYAK